MAEKSPLILLDERSGRCWVMGENASWFREAADGPWLPEGEFAPPDAEDLAENFAAITGKEADSLLMSARASAKD